MANRTLLISIGSNMADGEFRLTATFDFLRREFGYVEISPIYRTDSVSGDGSVYYNAVARVTTDREDSEVDASFKVWEISQGRNDEMRRLKLVPVDLDIVISGDKVIRPRDAGREYFQYGYRLLSESHRNDQPCILSEM